MAALKKEEGHLARLESLDVNLSKRISIYSYTTVGGYSRQILRTVLLILEFSGHGIPWLCVPAFYVYTGSRELREFSFNLIIAMLFDLVVVGLIKVVVRRKRPSYNNHADMYATVQVDKFSFPSGHTTRGVLAAAIFISILDNGVYDIALGLWAVILAVSRVVLGRHHITDVVAGMVIGLLEASVILPSAKATKFVTVIGVFSNSNTKVISPLAVLSLAYNPLSNAMLFSYL